MGKVIINKKEVEPAKKVKLYKKIKRTEVTKLLQEKREQLKNEQNKA